MDPIVEEIHLIRKSILDECENDAQKYLDRLKAREINDQELLVSEVERPKELTSKNT